MPPAHRTAPSLGQEMGFGRLIGRTKGGMSSKPHTVPDARERPLRVFLTAEQRSNEICARALLNSLPPGKQMLANRGR